MSLLDDIAGFIDGQSTALTLLSGTQGNLSKGELPDSGPAPDTMVALYETGGLPTLSSWSTGEQDDRQFTRHRFQVLSRSTSYPTAHDNATVVFGLLDGIARRLPTSTGLAYGRIDAVQPPFDIGKDGNERHLVSTNYDAWRAVSRLEVLGGAFGNAYASAFDLV